MSDGNAILDMFPFTAYYSPRTGVADPDIVKRHLDLENGKQFGYRYKWSPTEQITKFSTWKTVEYPQDDAVNDQVPSDIHIYIHLANTQGRLRRNAMRVILPGKKVFPDQDTNYCYVQIIDNVPFLNVSQDTKTWKSGHDLSCTYEISDIATDRPCVHVNIPGVPHTVQFQFQQDEHDALGILRKWIARKEEIFLATGGAQAQLKMRLRIAQS